MFVVAAAAACVVELVVFVVVVVAGWSALSGGDDSVDVGGCDCCERDDAPDSVSSVVRFVAASASVEFAAFAVDSVFAAVVGSVCFVSFVVAEELFAVSAVKTVVVVASSDSAAFVDLTVLRLFEIVFDAAAVAAAAAAAVSPSLLCWRMLSSCSAG